MTSNSQKSSILELRNISTRFPLFSKDKQNQNARRYLYAVQEISLKVGPGEILGIVGESGCGKSTLARTTTRLVEPMQGSILWNGQDVTHLNRHDLRSLRPAIQMVFQDPFSSLNPRMTVFDTLAEALRVGSTISRTSIKNEVAKLLDLVGLQSMHMQRFPHEFSGGQRQRIAIARALAPKPKLLIADEPVSALDVSVAAQIVNLLDDLCQAGLSMICISHDLSMVAHLSGRIAVMYLGRIVEIGPASEVYATGAHPYTRALISAVPIADPVRERLRLTIPLQGDPPSPMAPPPGCPFHPRCHFMVEACTKAVPLLEEVSATSDHFVACIRHREIKT